MALVDELTSKIQDIWLKKIRRDAIENRLWNNEDALVASLHFHLRNDSMLKKNRLLRIWLNPTVFLKKDIKLRPDLVIVHLPDETTIDRKTYESYASERLMVAIEFKSRSQVQSYPYIEKDFERLRDIKIEFPGVGTIFCILDDNKDYTRRLEYVTRMSNKYKVLTLFGNDHHQNKWQAVSPSNV